MNTLVARFGTFFFIPLIIPPEYKPIHLWAHPKILMKLYKPRAYNRNFTVYKVFLLLNEYGDLPFLFQNLSSITANNQLAGIVFFKKKKNYLCTPRTLIEHLL